MDCGVWAAAYLLTDLLIPIFSHSLFIAERSGGWRELYVVFSFLMRINISLCCF